jgi:hypothetical protein
MPFFIEFLKSSGLFDKWVEDCPLRYSHTKRARPESTESALRMVSDG